MTPPTYIGVGFSYARVGKTIALKRNRKPAIESFFRWHLALTPTPIVEPRANGAFDHT
jgi:hypothetical protein